MGPGQRDHGAAQKHTQLWASGGSGSAIPREARGTRGAGCRPRKDATRCPLTPGLPRPAAPRPGRARCSCSAAWPWGPRADRVAACAAALACEGTGCAQLRPLQVEPRRGFAYRPHGRRSPSCGVAVRGAPAQRPGRVFKTSEAAGRLVSADTVCVAQAPASAPGLQSRPGQPCHCCRCGRSHGDVPGLPARVRPDWAAGAFLGPPGCRGVLRAALPGSFA